MVVVLLTIASCSRREPHTDRTAPPPDTAAARAIARDQPERLVLPLAPAGSGRVSFAAVSPVRESLAVAPVMPSTLDLSPPPADIALPPADSAVAAVEPAGALDLKPPIPRGRPVLPRGGRGGAVTLDVRVDEAGEVSDVEMVATDADSATVRAAEDAAQRTRYFPALLGRRPVAVWTRQVFEVARGR